MTSQQLIPTVQTVQTTLTPQEIEQLGTFEQARFTANTHRAHTSDIKQFTRFLGDRYPEMKDPSQSGLDQVLAFVVAQKNAGIKAASVRRRLSTLKHALPDIAEAEWKRIYANVGGMRRMEATGVPLGKDPLLANNLRQLLSIEIHRTHYSDTHRRRDRALLLFLWYSGCRRSEVSALRWRDLLFTDEGVFITIRKSKGDQEGRGATLFIHSREDKADDCPVAALTSWRGCFPSASVFNPERHVFIELVERKGVEGHHMFRENTYGEYSLNPDQVHYIVKDRCKRAGLDETRFGCHSFRSGLATQAALNGVELIEIRDQLRHKSVETTGKYLKNRQLSSATGITTRV